MDKNLFNLLWWGGAAGSRRGPGQANRRWNTLTRLHCSGCEALHLQEWALWVRQPGTIPSQAASPCLVSGVNTVSDGMSSGCLLAPVDECGYAEEEGQRSSLSPRCGSGTSAQTCQRLSQVHPEWRHGAGQGSLGALHLQSFSPGGEKASWKCTNRRVRFDAAHTHSALTLTK